MLLSNAGQTLKSPIMTAVHNCGFVLLFDTIAYLLMKSMILINYLLNDLVFFYELNKVTYQNNLFSWLWDLARVSGLTQQHFVAGQRSRTTGIRHHQKDQHPLTPDGD